MKWDAGVKRYPLNGLLKLRKWDLDAASREIAKARETVEQRAQEVRGIGDAISRLEEEFRRSCESGAVIEPAKHGSLYTHLREKRLSMQRKLQELKDAEATYEKARRKLFSVKQGVMVLEKHKEGKDLEYRQESIRNEQKQSDDIWLLRRTDKQS